MVARQGEIETVVAGFTDHYGRLMGKRFDAEMFVDDVAKRRQPRLRLSPHGRHGDGAGPRLPLRQLGARLRRRPPGAGPGDAARRELARQDRVRPVRRQEREDARLRAVAPRSILRRQVDAARQAGLPAMAATELEHYLFRTSYRDAAQQGYRNLEPAGWYLEDYHILQGTRTEGFHAAARRHLKRSGVPVETSKGEWGRGQHELNVRYAEVLEMADRHVGLQAVPEGARRGQQGMSVTFMAKFAADRRRLELPHPLQPVARRQECLRRRRRPDALQALVPRRLARPRPRRDGVLRADGQLLQALRRRVVGADAARLELRQPHRRLPRRRRRRGPAHRVPHPRRRLQPLPRARRRARLAAWTASRNRIEPPECFVGDVYAAERAAARALHAPRGGRRVRSSRIRTAARSARTWSSTTRISIRTEAGRVRQSGDRLGAPAILRADLNKPWKQGQTTFFPCRGPHR